jgi:hypothetical protein
MELNFDKEIDALLRQAAKSESFVGTNGSDMRAHIDADALSAFAENALPEKTRALYMTHLGDCDRCRKILSSLIVLNSEADVSAASLAEVPEIAVVPAAPWYRKLFLFPNLAYTMGALVLVFSGLLGFVIIRNLGDRQTNVAGVANKQPAPSDAIAPAAVPIDSNSSMPAANAMGNSNSAISAEPGRPGLVGVDTNSISTDEPGSKENNFMLDGADRSAGPPAARATPDPDDDRTRDEAIVTRRDPITEGEKKNETPIDLARSAPAPPPPPPAPESRAAGQATRSEDLPKAAAKSVKDLKMQPAPAKPDAAESSSGRRQVSGKNFNRRDGVWYDAAYSGQATTDVRRGSSEYKKLDSGLRSIANSLSGTVVVVWKSKAYRIQ